jgi:argininosuccinate synthase
MNKIKKQQERFDGLLQLIKENPDLKIVPMVCQEVCAGDDFAYWMGKWGKAEIDEIYHEDERIYFRSIDEDELGDDIFNNLEEDNPHWSDSYLEEQTDKELSKINWKNAIVVKIELP